MRKSPRVRYDAFISYSQTADGRLAPAVQQGLQRLARPWYKRRALHIFRDDTGLSATPDLWASIQKALDESGQFIVLASPEAAQSRWVAREIEHWRATRPGDAILTAITEGEWSWDDAGRDFDWEHSPAIPQALKGAFQDEPKVTDLRWARDELELDLRNARFRRALAGLAAPLHGLSPDDIEGEDVRQHRRFRRIATATMAVLAILVVLASVATVLALRSRDRARAQARTILARSLAQTAKGESPRLAALLGLEAFKLDHGTDERAAVLRALASTPSSLAVLRGTSGAVSHVEFSAARHVLSAGVDGTLRLWDVDKPAQPIRSGNVPVNTFAFLTDGTVIGRTDGKVEFTLNGHDTVRAAHSLKVESVAVTPDEKIAATASNDGTIRFWQLPAGRPLGEAVSAPGSTSSIAFDRAGRVLYSVGSAGALRRWDVSTHAEIGTAAPITRFALSAVAVNAATGEVAAGGAERQVYFLDPGGKALRRPSLTSGGSVLTLAFSGDGRHLAVGEAFGMVEIWNALGRVPVNPPLTGHDGPVVSVAFSPNGRLLASSGDDGTVRIWRVGARGLDSVTSRATDIVWSVALDSSGGKAAEAAYDGSVRVWKTGAGQAASTTVRAARVGNAAFSVAFDPAGRVLFDGLTVGTASGTADYIAEAWDVTGTPRLKWRRTFINAKPGGVVRVAVVPGASLVAVSAESHAVQLLDASTGKTRTTIATGNDVVALAVSPDGSELATSHGDMRIRLWRLRDGAREQALTGPSGLTFGLAFSPAGDRLAASDQGGRVSLWVRHAGAFADQPLLALHRGAMESVVFSPDGQTLAATGADGVLALWDVASGGLFAELPSGGAESPSAAWRGRTLLTGQDDGLVAAWDADLGSLDLARATARLCPVAKPALSRAEWRNFLPGQAYSPLCR